MRSHKHLLRLLPAVFLIFLLFGCDNTVTPTVVPLPITPTFTPPSITLTPAPITVTPAPTSLTLFETPRDGPAPIVNAIQGATRAVDVEVYELTDAGVINALIAEQQAGKPVRVILNAKFPTGGNQNAATFQKLQNAGVAVKWSSSTFRFTHEKAIIIDAGQASQRVLIMTMNLSPSYLGEPDPGGLGPSLNFGLVDPSPSDIAQVEGMFNADWNNQAYSAPAGTDLVISPINSRVVLLQQIQGATRSLHFFAQEFEDTGIVNAVVAAAQRGVEVRGLVANNIAGNQPNADKVKAAGGQVRFLTNPYQHSKSVIADGAQVYIGSINFTATSMDQNRELGILTKQADIASQMETEFAKFWNQGTNVP